MKTLIQHMTVEASDWLHGYVRDARDVIAWGLAVVLKRWQR